MVKSWQKTGSEYLGDFRIFRIRADSSRSPRTGQVHRFFVLESPDWVNVIPLTPEGNVVMIRQFRHGSDRVSLEIPGGLIDPHERDPIEAARRELREETGFEAEHIEPIGVMSPNPAMMTNRCFAYLATGCRRVCDLRMDPGEDIEVVTVPVAELDALLRQTIRNLGVGPDREQRIHRARYAAIARETTILSSQHLSRFDASRRLASLVVFAREMESFLRARWKRSSRTPLSASSTKCSAASAGAPIERTRNRWSGGRRRLMRRRGRCLAWRKRCWPPRRAAKIRSRPWSALWAGNA